jgi:hypothetical protein
VGLVVLAVQIFIADILYKLSKPPNKGEQSTQEYIEKRLKDLEASSHDYVHRTISLLEIERAFQVHKELE